MTQYRRTSRLLVGLLAAPLVGGMLLSAPADASTVPSGTVKGTVTVAGVPLAGAKVTLVRRDGDSGDAFQVYKTVTTNSAGRYSLTRPRGSSTTWWYDHVVVSDPKDRAVTDDRQFMGNKSRTVTRNVTLRPAGAISGKVTRADGGSPSKIRAQIVDGPDSSLIENLDVTRYDVERGVDANGAYRFRGLPSGTYTLCYHDTSARYRDMCFDEAVTPQEATGVTVKERATTTVREQVLARVAPHLKGTVTTTSGVPLSKIRVTGVLVGSTNPAGETSTWSSGGFDLTPQTPGAAQLLFEDPRGVWASHWYNSPRRSGARSFALTDGTTIRDLDVKLKSTAALAVTSTSRSGRTTFRVEVTRRATGHHPSGTITVTRHGITRTASLTKGVATVTLVGVPAGRRTFTVDYTGTSSTADARTTVKAVVR